MAAGIEVLVEAAGPRGCGAAEPDVGSAVAGPECGTEGSPARPSGAGRVADRKAGFGFHQAAVDGGGREDEPQHPVAQRSQGPIAEGGRLQDGVGAGLHGAGEGPPLLVIAVQQRLGGLAGDHLRKFPAEVDRVLDAAVHALGTGWGMHVGGVTDEEDPVLAEGAGQVALDPEPPEGPRVGDEAVVGHRVEGAGGSPVTRRRMSSSVGSGRSIAAEPGPSPRTM